MEAGAAFSGVLAAREAAGSEVETLVAGAEGGREVVEVVEVEVEAVAGVGELVVAGKGLCWSPPRSTCKHRMIDTCTNTFKKYCCY